MHFVKVLGLGLSVFVSGCTTLLWSPKYKEVSITGFHINTASGDLIATNDEFAYVFQIDGGFAEILINEVGVCLDPRFSGFELNSSNEISGEVNLVVCEKQQLELEKQQLEAMGFNDEYGIGHYIYEQFIEGERYKIEGEMPFEAMSAAFTIMVAQPPSTSGAIGKLLASPLTIAYDRVSWLFRPPL